MSSFNKTANFSAIVSVVSGGDRLDLLTVHLIEAY